MSNPVTQAPCVGKRSEPSGESALPQAPRLHAQLAGLIEGESFSDRAAGEIRPLLEFLRLLLNAQAVAVLPLGEHAHLSLCIVTGPGVPAEQLATLVGQLDALEATVRPAPELGEDAYTIAIPVCRDGVPSCWLVTQLGTPNPRDLRAYVVLLQALGGFLLYRDERRATYEVRWALERTASLIELVQRTGSERDFERAARIAVDALRDYFGCARVLLGWKRGAGFRIRAISGMARIDAKSVAHQPIEAALREAAMAGRRIDFRAGSARTVGLVAHELLQEITDAEQLTTIPIPRGGLMLEWSAEAPPDAETATLLDAAAPFLPSFFDLLERARPNRAAFVVSRVWSRLSSHRRGVVVAAAVTLTGLLACPFPYTIRADCRLAPTVKRVIAAPFPAQLKTSFVRPGDRVAEGQPLAELDNRELQLKEAELTAACDRALKERDRKMSNEGEGADFAAAQLANFEAQSIGQELALTRRRLEMLALKSPLSGIVISGDLRRAEGQPVQQGEVLFEVAPLEEMIVEVDVPDREISRVRPGMPLRFHLEAFAGQQWTGAVERLHPRSEQREGRNVFTCEAPVRNVEAHSDLRPGMRGRAAIESDRRSLLWILGHRLWDFLVERIFW
jgi:multidrug efflux pump subunit AcrA (membrane-fusion protein)